MKNKTLIALTVASVLFTANAFAVYPAECKTIAQLKTNPQVSAYRYFPAQHIALVALNGMTIHDAPNLGVALKESVDNQSQAYADAIQAIQHMDANIVPAVKKYDSGDFCSYVGDLDVDHPESTTQFPSILGAGTPKF